VRPTHNVELFAPGLGQFVLKFWGKIQGFLGDRAS